MKTLTLTFVFAFVVASQIFAVEMRTYKTRLSDGSIYLVRETFLSPAEEVPLIAAKEISDDTSEGNVYTSHETELLDREGKIIARRAWNRTYEKLQRSIPARYEAIEGDIKGDKIYLLMRLDLGYSDDYCFQVHSFANGKLARDFILTRISMERSSRGPSCNKIELVDYDEHGNVEVLIHPRVGEDLAPYRKKFGPNGDPSNDRIK